MAVKVKLKMEGIRELLRGPAAQQEVIRRARRGAKAAGEGFEAVVRPGRYTARALLWTTDDASRKREAESKVLIRALDAMR